MSNRLDKDREQKLQPVDLVRDTKYKIHYCIGGVNHNLIGIFDFQIDNIVVFKKEDGSNIYIIKKRWFKSASPI